MDIPYAKCQALIIRRIGDRLKKMGLSNRDNDTLDWADHLLTERSYLMDALDMQEEER